MHHCRWIIANSHFLKAESLTLSNDACAANGGFRNPCQAFWSVSIARLNTQNSKEIFIENSRGEIAGSHYIYKR